MLDYFHDDPFLVAARAYPFEGRSLFVDVDACVDIAALESDADEVFLGHDPCPSG